jgi:hypothetical protein
MNHKRVSYIVTDVEMTYIFLATIVEASVCSKTLFFYNLKVRVPPLPVHLLEVIQTRSFQLPTSLGLTLLEFIFCGCVKDAVHEGVRQVKRVETSDHTIG